MLVPSSTPGSEAVRRGRAGEPLYGAWLAGKLRGWPPPASFQRHPSAFSQRAPETKWLSQHVGPSFYRNDRRLQAGSPPPSPSVPVLKPGPVPPSLRALSESGRPLRRARGQTTAYPKTGAAEGVHGGRAIAFSVPLAGLALRTCLLLLLFRHAGADARLALKGGWRRRKAASRRPAPGGRGGPGK